jgi:predicted 2-oxoglutarate/Fe(II)-dependent dioxygenase YbiX
VYVRNDFLSRDFCESLRSAIVDAPGDAATIYAGTATAVDPSIRRARDVEVAGELRAAFASRLEAAMPALARHFALPLTVASGASFLRYEAGDFFRPHRDRASRDASDGGNETASRRVSVVVFLNEQRDPPGEGEYGGGSLTLFGLVDAPEWRGVGIPVTPAAGMLVAFDSTVLHEVTPVTAGRRITAVDWLS